MGTLVKLRFNLIQIYEITHLSTEFIDKSVEHGIIDPSGSCPQEWLFDTHQLNVLRKAARLRNDLGLNWNGLALAIDLLEELSYLRNENKAIKNRLERFLKD
jgi:chaperone modulatory protein CbpM